LSFLGILFFSVVQLLFFSGLVLIWMRMKKDQADDSRWSRNLQIIQSKIAVFEDLSDRTETQVNQLTMMLENKMCDLQRKIDEADEILGKISSSMKKSMEVAQIFQDKIPHEEIIERQNTVKFVRAALMAHEGKTAEEIADSVQLPASQIEFIVKVNAQRLSFDPLQMPDWLKQEVQRDFSTSKISTNLSASENTLAKTTLRPLHQIMQQRFSVPEDILVGTEKKDLVAPVAEERTESIMESNNTPNNSYGPILNRNGKEVHIRPVVFPRIDGTLRH